MRRSCLVVIALVAVLTPSRDARAALIGWMGNVSPCPDPWYAYVTIFDTEPFEVYVDIYEWSGGCRASGPCPGITASLDLVPVATNQGGEGVMMEYFGDFMQWIPVTRVYDIVDRYRAVVPVAMLRRNTEVYYRIGATDRTGGTYPANACGGDGRLLKLRIRHDAPVATRADSWATIKGLYR